MRINSSSSVSFLNIKFSENLSVNMRLPIKYTILTFSSVSYILITLPNFRFTLLKSLTFCKVIQEICVVIFIYLNLNTFNFSIKSTHKKIYHHKFVYNTITQTFYKYQTSYDAIC